MDCNHSARLTVRGREYLAKSVVARRYENSAQRLEQLQPWTHQYNWHRRHASLHQKPPISRSGLDVNNFLKHHKLVFPEGSSGQCPDRRKEIPNRPGQAR
jgi:hypothetical protein